MFDYEQYLRREKFPHIWCAGCGHGTVLKSLIRALHKEHFTKDQICVISGIGCSSRTPGYLDFNTLHTTHGRALTFATGVKLAKPELHVIVITGDGDCTAIGGNHFIHAARRNIDLTVIVENNFIYGMTGGQASPTTPEGARTSTSSYGAIDPGFDIAGLAQAAGASFVARGTAFDAVKLENYIRAALKSPGFCVVEALAQCPTAYGRYNRQRGAVEMLNWFKNNTIPIEQAQQLAPEELEGKYTTGILLQRKNGKGYIERYKELQELAKSRATELGPERARLDDKDSRTAPDQLTQFGRTEIRLSGSGGQGMILAGVILGEAAAIYDHRNAAQSQSYGPEARGGASMSDVVITEGEIDDAHPTNLDVLVALTSEAANRYSSDIKSGGLVIVDASTDTSCLTGDFKLIPLPIVETAQEKLGRSLVANIVALGVVVELTGVVSKEAIQCATSNRVPPGTERLNMMALNAGFSLAQEYMRQAD